MVMERHQQVVEPTTLGDGMTDIGCGTPFSSVGLSSSAREYQGPNSVLV